MTWLTMAACCAALWAQSPTQGTFGSGMDLWAGVGHSSAVYFATPYIGAYPVDRVFAGAKITVGQAAFRVGNDTYLTAGPCTRFYFFPHKITPVVQAGLEYGVSTRAMRPFTAVHAGMGVSISVKKDFAVELLAQYMYFGAQITPERRGLDAFMVGAGFQGMAAKKKKKKKTEKKDP